MEIKVLSDADAVAREAAKVIAAEARAAVAARGCFVVAVSGGKTPWCVFRAIVISDSGARGSAIPGIVIIDSGDGDHPFRRW
jgi:6-phosphogluconolactonase/glucosamine-6-phosphate isomerase/deaminase